MINYEKIVQSLRNDKIIELLEKLGVDDIVEKDNCIITNTICHNISGGSMKLYYYFDSHIFYCYSSCQSMSIFKFLKKYYELRNIDYDWYNDIFRVILSCTDLESIDIDCNSVNKYISVKDKYGIKKNRIDLKTYPSGILNVFIKKYPVEWLNDGISKESMDKYNIRYSISQNKIIIPHYNIDGQLVGIRGRALDEWEIENVGKYMPVEIENVWYNHPLSLNLYGLNLSKDNIYKYKICFIGEGEKFCLQLDNFSIPNCSVAVCGSQLNKYHIDLLLRHCFPNEIIICFDKEEKDNSDNYFNKLWNLCSKYKNYTQISFIYDRNNLLNLKNSPTDKGEEIFKKLLSLRVKV